MTSSNAAKHAHLAMSSDIIGKNVKAIARTGQAFDKLVHETGVAIIIASMPHAEGGHLDAGKALDYIKALPPGASRNRVVAWMHEFSNIRFTATRQPDKSFKFGMKLLKMGDDEYRTARPVEAYDQPHWDLNQEGAPVPIIFDQRAFDRMLSSMISRADKAIAAGTLALPAKDLEALARMRRVQAEVHTRAEGMAAPKPVAKPAKPAAERQMAAEELVARGLGMLERSLR